MNDTSKFEITLGPRWTIALNAVPLPAAQHRVVRARQPGKRRVAVTELADQGLADPVRMTGRRKTTTYSRGWQPMQHSTEAQVRS